jgi:hypothetical protein
MVKHEAYKASPWLLSRCRRCTAKGWKWAGFQRQLRGVLSTEGLPKLSSEVLRNPPCIWFKPICIGLSNDLTIRL